MVETKKTSSSKNTKKVSTYQGKEKIYYTKNKSVKKRRMKLGARIVLCVIGFIFFFVIGISCFNLSNKLNEKHLERINYSETGNSKFKVYLKNNSYYESDYLESGMNYVTNLINMINVNYNYEIHADEKINYEYKYDVNAKLIINERDKDDKILFTKNYPLIKEKTLKNNGTNFVVNENVDIDFNKYNDYVNQYKKDYSLDADAKLIVTMNIITNGNIEDSNDSINKNNKYEMTIPLSEQTIDITKNNDNISTSGTLVINKKVPFDSLFILVISIILLLTSIYFMFRVVYIVITNNKSKSLYERTISKYLRQYDRAIVQTNTPDIDETQFKDIVRVLSMNELLDLHDNLKYPILHYEVVPGEKSYFVIRKDDILYKLTISDAYLNKNGDK